MDPKAIFSHVAVVDPQRPCLPLIAAVWMKIPEAEQQEILDHLLTISFVRYSKLTRSKKRALKLTGMQDGATIISQEGKYLIYIDTDQVDDALLQKMIALQLALALSSPAREILDHLSTTNETKAKVYEWGFFVP